MAEEWVNEARNATRHEINLRHNAKKALGAAKQENKELFSKLNAKERERKSPEAGLKTAEA